MVLLRTHSCTITDIIGALKCKVLEHYSSVCAACEVTELLVVFFLLFCIFVYCLSFIRCVLLPTWRINVFIISCRRQCCRFRHNNSVGVDTGFVAHRLCDCVNTTTDQIQTSQATDR